MALQSMTALASITLQEASASVSFSGIPQNYRDLIIVVSSKVVASESTIGTRFNGDTGSNYSRVRAGGDGSNISSVSATGTTIISGLLTTARMTTQEGFTAIINVFDYSSTDKFKSVLSRSGNGNNGVEFLAATWQNNLTINSVTIHTISGGSEFAAGSTFNLYGRIS